MSSIFPSNTKLIENAFAAANEWDRPTTSAVCSPNFCGIFFVCMKLRDVEFALADPDYERSLVVSLNYF